MHTDLRLDFVGEEYDFSSQSVSCPSSAGSFSTVSSNYDPFTPTSTSGRSTPQRRGSSIDDFEPITCPSSLSYEMTPPGSAFFPVDVKSEFPHTVGCDSMPTTPSTKRPILHTQIMDFDGSQILSAPLSSHGSLDSANPQTLQHYPFPTYMPPSPFEVPSQAYTLESTLYDTPSVWGCQGDNSQMTLLDRQDSPSMPMTLRHLQRDSMTHAYVPSNARRRHYLDDVQKRTGALHRAQYGGFMQSKRERDQARDDVPPGVSRIPKGMFYCDEPGCETRKPFKRSEHLKRHKSTIHNPNVDEISVVCEFCEKLFNRRDNWRQHLRLHTMENRAIRRTKYAPGAKEVYEAEMKRTKHRKQSKKAGLKEES